MNKHMESNKIICPNCESEFADNYEYAEDDYKIDCPICLRSFKMHRETTVKYTTKLLPRKRRNI